MGGKKRPSGAVEDSDAGNTAPRDEVAQKSAVESEKGDAFVETKEALPQPSKRMENLKRRRTLDKERRRLAAENKLSDEKKPCDTKDSLAFSSSSVPGLHLNLFGDLASADSSVREAAVQALVADLSEVQKVYEEQKRESSDEHDAPLEAEKDDGLDECSPSMRYAIRRLIRGVSSSRECARQGFALALTAILESFSIIKLDAVMRLIVDLLEISSAMKGQDAKESLLGRLFAYGALARSGRITSSFIMDHRSSVVKDFTSQVISLAGKKRYLSEPAVSVILDITNKDHQQSRNEELGPLNLNAFDLIILSQGLNLSSLFDRRQLPLEAINSEVLRASGVREWFDKASEVGNPDALFFALNLQQKVNVDEQIFGKLLPHPFNSETFFSRDHLAYLAPSLMESSFCLPRVHSLWPMVVNLLVPEMTQDEEAAVRITSSKKQKRSRKGGSFEDLARNIRCFSEAVIESFLQSSHDRKHLLLSILLLILPRLPPSCIHIVLSSKLVQCVMDVLSNKDSLLHNAGQHFLKELVNLAGDDNERRIAIIIALQKHSSGRLDNITRTQTVKDLVSRFDTVAGCLLFVQNLMNVFVDDGADTDEPSDQSHTTDENSELGSSEDRDTTGNTDTLKNWIVYTMPRVLKNLKLESSKKSLPHEEILKHMEAKFRVQTEITKFLSVQGLFSASLGTEVTSFELQEKFKWPKSAISSSLCQICIEQLQLVLDDAHREQSSHVLGGMELYDLGSFFMCFLNTLFNIPSVSLFRSLSSEDDNAFKKLLAMESRLSQEERKIGPGLEANKMHSFRYLLIQLVLQVLLHPGELSETALELVICCKKAFPVSTADFDISDIGGYGGDDMPEMMDVLVDNLLSLLPRSSGPLYFAVEQVFRFFCDDITDAGLLQMLRIVGKDLKPSRHTVTNSDGEEEDDDFIGIEEAEVDEVENMDDDHDDDDVGSDEMNGSEASGDEVDKKIMDSSTDDMEAVDTNKDDNSDSDDSDGGLDDDAMFRIDSYFARKLQEKSGSDNAQSLLMPFKFRVLSLLELYLQKNPGKPQILTVYSYLARSFVNAHAAKGGKELRDRIGAILQKKILKAKDLPKGDKIQISDLESLLTKSLRSVSRSQFKEVSALAQASTLWLLQIIHSCNCSKSELKGVVAVFKNIMVEYFNNKKSRLRSEFLEEVIKKNQWIGAHLFEYLLKNCGSAKIEFRRIDGLDIIRCITKSCILSGKAMDDKDASSKSALLKKHLPAICELIQLLLSNMSGKKSRRVDTRRFCSWILNIICMHHLKKSFLKVLKPDVQALLESQLGEKFHPFKTS